MSNLAPTPVHFPSLENEEKNDLSPEIIERITLVLAGISPRILDEISKKPPTKSRNLQQIRFDKKTTKVSPSRELLNDHRYLLWPQHPIDQESFETLWQNSRTVAGGQESSALIQRVRWLRKLDTAFDKNLLRGETDQKLLSSIPELAPRILFFLFRSAIRHIERDAEKKAPKPQESSKLMGMMLRLGIVSTPSVPPIYFPDSMLQETEAYVETAMKLGRIVRLADRRGRQARA